MTANINADIVVPEDGKEQLMSAISADYPLKSPAQSDADGAELDVSLVEAFERAAEAHPTRIALDSGAHRLSYRELNTAANRLAHRLIRGGGVSEDRVAILMAHDAPAIAAVVAAAKAGRIAMALNPGDPASRLGMLIEDAEPSVIVTDAENRPLADDIARPSCKVLTYESETAEGPSHNPSIGIGPEQTVSLVYTSGSTGRSKGVMKTHRQLCRNAAAHTEAMQYTETDRIPLFSAISTGQGTTGLWCALLNGATLCPFPVKSRGVTGLAGWIVDRGLTVYVSSASIFRALVKTIDNRFVFPGVRAVRLASESVTKDDVALFRRHFPAESVFVHTLSSSETGNIAWSRWTKDDEIPEGRLPIGHVSRGIEVLLLGEDGQPVPSGEIGEIAVKSRYLAAGYWRDPVLTAKRFSDDLDGRGTRLVRNGDWGRINAKGQIEFCGRKDDRIKIRGNRIELADIEWAMAKLPGIERAAAVAIPRDNHEPMLVAFVVLTTDATWSVPRLRHAVAANLPLHMVPSRFVFVDGLPFGPGGKIDRNALRSYRLPSRDAEIGEAPQTETETLLADIWAEALDLPQIARDDDFFNLGGDSLKGAIIAAQVYSAFGIEINLAAIADHPTISALAPFIEERGRRVAARPPPIMPIPRDGPVPLSLFQERAWRATEVRPGDVSARSYHISGPIDIQILKECFGYLVERHEILRTTFAVVDGRPAQIVHSAAPLGFSFVDVSNEEDPEGRAESICLSEAAKAIDPATLPMTRLLLIRIGEDEHWLLRTAHWLTQDGWSFPILMNEFAALYEARLRGMDPPIPKDMPLQYADYAVWHREVMQRTGPVYMDMLAWWKQLFSRRARAAKLPFRRSTPKTDIDPGQGVIQWKLDDAAAERLDGFAREAGVTHFIVRLACFVALVADMTGRSPVVIGTSFATRSRVETRHMVGFITNLVPLVFSYLPKLAMRDWVETVRNRLFETEAHAEIPFEDLYEQLRGAGLRPPSVRILFSMSAEMGEQRIGSLTLKRRPHPVAKMPWGCQVHIDERAPENCRVDFNAGLYRREGMQEMIDRYLRLLDAAARRPDLSIGRLVTMSSGNPIRRAWAYYMTPAAAFIPPQRTNRPAPTAQAK